MIEDRESKIENRGPIRQFAILYLLSSILDSSLLKPAARFGLASAAYETAALPIELRRRYVVLPTLHSGRGENRTLTSGL